ncbi:MAG: FAD-dependent oxidoreductase [Actinomycetota bacterium]
MSDTPHVVIVGAGITGAAAAHHLATNYGDRLRVSMIERNDCVGGVLGSSTFAGVDHVDEAADAFLARVPDAVALAAEVGLGDDLVHPEPVGAAVWHDRLHPIPSGLVLGVPGDLRALARTSLFSWRGRLRAATEPLLPRRSIDHDSLGRHIRARFGNEVHDRLVDALVGSIYAADTDDFSLAEVPQIAALASSRSLLLAALAQQRRTPSAGTASGGAAAAVFAVPRTGAASLARAAAERAAAAGAALVTGVDASIEQADDAWSVNGERADAIVLTGRTSGVWSMLGHGKPFVSSDLATALAAGSEGTDVVMVTLHVPAGEWPERLRGMSGYLVPKPVQRRITAVSFASQKWGHWRPPDGGEILRVSLGRQGAPILHLDDDAIIQATLDDLRHHLDGTITPAEVRITRWRGAFAHYRPHHRRWVDDVRRLLPAGVFVAGSGFDGMGLPACVRSAKTNAERAADHALALPG